MELVSDIFELDINSFQKFQESILIVQNVGSDISDLSTRITKAIKLIESDKKADAKTELINLYILLQSATKGTEKVEALKCLCRDKESFDSYTAGELYDKYEEVKKKFLTS